MIELKTPRIEHDLDTSYQTPSPFTVRAQYELPVTARSILRSEQASFLSGGITRVLSDLLLGRLSLQASDQAQTVLIRNHQGLSAFAAHRDQTSVWATTTGDWQETVMLAFAIALTTDRLPHLKEGLHHFLQLLAQSGLRYPFIAATLHASSSSQPLLHALSRVADTLDAEVRLELETGRLQALPTERTTHLDEQLSDVSLAELLYPVKKASRNTNYDRLLRLIQRGGAALLVGPPGTFKTETAKKAAVDSGAALVIAKGAPGVEDRDFLGGVYPTAQGPRWVDGPISRAFVLAARQKTVLLIDEALRYLPETLNVLIGAMDTVSRAEVQALGLGGTLPSEGERFYVLPLPNGDHLCCPAHQLTWVMTTNMGADHHQVTDRLDAALQSRLDFELYFGVPDRETAAELYTQITGNRTLAELGWKAEQMTRDLLVSDRKNLVRPLEARKVIGLLKETGDLMASAGLSLPEAFLEAFMTVAVPYCCKRDEYGQAEFGMSGMLRERVLHDVLRSA